MSLERSSSLQPWILRSICAAVAVLLCHGRVRGESTVERPDLATAKPQAVCKLQSLPAQRDAPMMPSGVIFYAQPAADDDLSNYERTALGDWQMPSDVDRNDPWLRFVLFARKQPVVIDVAVFVDDKPYADGREAWIDAALAPAETESSTSVDQSKQNDVIAEKNEAISTKVIVPAATNPAKVKAQAREAPAMRERLRDYVATAIEPVDRREIRWLISEWGFGPPVVVMDRSLSWQRAGVAPLLACLDADRSGTLEAKEVAAAPETLRRADADANDVVDLQEIERKFNDPPVLPFAADHALVVAMNDATDVDSLAADVKRLYGWDTDRAEHLASAPADATVRVEFGQDSQQSEAVAIFAEDSAVRGDGDAITFDLGAEYVEISAASGDADDVAGVAATQIAVGAVIDGSPLWRLADGDHDGRLTLRERQRLPTLLESLDRNGDGALAADELPIPIRFAVTRGPHVHRLLSKQSTATRTATPPATAPELPDWFLAMDTNRDRDLSRAEFLGTAEQFGQFDADHDGLLSVDEALKMMPED